MLCLCALLRRRWSEEERLSYPVNLVSVAGDGRGREVMAVRDVLVGHGHRYRPLPCSGVEHHLSFPRLPLRGRWDWGQLIPQRPWNALGVMPFGLYPFAVGLGIFMPLDLSFSCWFFYLVHRLERVMVAALGWDVDPRVPYFPEQATATWVALCLFLLWRAKTSLWQSWSSPASTDEPMPPKRALLGFLGCLECSRFSVGASACP